MMIIYNDYPILLVIYASRLGSEKKSYLERIKMYEVARKLVGSTPVSGIMVYI